MMEAYEPDRRCSRQWLLCFQTPRHAPSVDLWSMIVASPRITRLYANENVDHPPSLSLSLAPSRCSVHFVMIMLIACSCNHSAWQCAGPGVGRSIDKDLQMERALPATLINRPLLIRPDHLHPDIIAQARSPLSFPPLSHDIKYRRFWKTRPPRSDLSTIFLRFFLK